MVSEQVYKVYIFEAIYACVKENQSSKYIYVNITFVVHVHFTSALDKSGMVQNRVEWFMKNA